MDGKEGNNWKYFNRFIYLLAILCVCEEEEEKQNLKIDLKLIHHELMDSFKKSCYKQ